MNKPLRNIYVLMCIFLCLIGQAFSQQTLTQINGWNAYVHLPASYNGNSNTYPTIIFFPGLGEVGTNASAVISNGPGAYIAQGWNGNVIVNGNTTEFIVISLQTPTAYPGESTINTRIQTIKSQYRVNPNKLYLTGLSHGGWCSSTFVSGDPYGGPYTYASQIAAVVTVEGVIPDDNTPYPNLFDNYANAGGRYLGFEQVNDGRDTRTVVNRMNATRANSAIYVSTNFGGGGHCCWSSFYGGGGAAPTNFVLDGVSQNLYQWLARQSFGGTVTPPANQSPVANAGGDKVITLPTSSTSLTGSGTDSDGSVSAYLWTKISGPAAGVITNSTSATATVSGLTQGVYQYQLKVTDDDGATATDNIQVTVNAAANAAPVANAGGDKSITLPTSSINITGNGNDNDGSISAYSWTKVSGPGTTTINNSSSATATFNNLTQGVYVFRLTVTDDDGATGADDISVTVNAQLVVNPPATPTTCNTNVPVVYNLTQTGPGEIYRPNGSMWKGGDTVKITGTNYSVIEFNNVGGDPCRPLVIMPLTTVTTPIFRIKGNCRYLKIWGGKTQYGIKVNGGPLAIQSSHHIEADNVECTGGNTGIYCKQDVSYSDTMTWYPNYRMTKFTFKNMWIHDIDGEGMYIGITQPSGLTVTSTRTGQDTVIIPIRLDSVEISNCLVERTTWDGIQLSNARNGNKIFNNTVRNYGTINMSSQQAGIILGGNCNGNVYGNRVIKGTGNGIQIFGYGVINVYNNTLDSCGYDGNTNSNGTQGQQSIYASDFLNGVEVNPKQTINAYGNAVNHPKTAGGIFITGYYNNSLPSSVYNNTFCIPNAAANWQNTFLKLNVAGSSNTNNILACAATTNTAPVANAGANQAATLPATATLNGSGTDADGSISIYQWRKISGPSAGTIVSASSASTVVNNLAQGVYLFELQVTDNNGAIGKDTMQLTVNTASNVAPVANAGVNQTVTLPTSTASLNGSGTDSDGTIASYLWTKISGTGSIFTNATSAATTVTGLSEGVYQFQLKVTDNAGATATSVTTVTVNAAATTRAIRVSIFGGSNAFSDSRWNNWNFNSSLSTGNLLYEDRTISTVSAVITGDVLITDNGINYAPSATTPPSGVLRYSAASTSYRTLTLRGLLPGKKYTIELYASRANSGNQTVFTTAGQSYTLNTSYNVNNYAQFADLSPNSSGVLMVTIDRIGTYSYLSGFSIIEQDGNSVTARGGNGNNTATEFVTVKDEKLVRSTVSTTPSVYPNPFESTFRVQINDLPAANYSLVLADISGKVVLTKRVVKAEGPQLETIQTTNLPGGIYILQIINENGARTTHKLVKN